VGLHGEGAPAGVRGPDKREGDGRTPAGVFELGQLYGRAPTSTLALPYTAMPDTLRCVDDPRSSHYGEIVASERASVDWRSAEDMPALYEYALVVEHNRARAAGRGSCIFMHAWRDADTPVTGCTAMHAQVLDELLAWLEPGALLVVLPYEGQAQLLERWGLQG
jgi:L,D-peptidoglycan transpeptidase YkuD (ErfK/YbiS/YcfS/YnhG family)